MNFHSITVAYNPDINLIAQLKIIQEAGIRPIVVFNSPYKGELDTLENIDILKNELNLGLAKAINMGVLFAQTKGCDGFFLFDQDSLPGESMLSSMINTINQLGQDQTKFGSLGPTIVNQTGSNNWPIPIRKSNKLCFWSGIGSGLKEVDFLITSGKYVPLAVWMEIGGYLESYFIDGLDIEWGYRAKFFGYKNFVTFDASLVHNLGDSAIRILPFMKRKMIIHSETRRYFMIRNYLWMLRLKYIPKDFKFHYGRKLMKMTLAICISPRQWKSLPKIFIALWDGALSHSEAIK